MKLDYDDLGFAVANSVLSDWGMMVDESSSIEVIDGEKFAKKLGEFLKENLE